MGEEYKIEWNGKTLVGVESDKCGNCVFYSGGSKCPLNESEAALCGVHNNEFGKSLKFIKVIESDTLYKIIEVYEKETDDGTQCYKNVDGSNSHYDVIDAIEIGDDVFLLEKSKADQNYRI